MRTAHLVHVPDSYPGPVLTDIDVRVARYGLVRLLIPRLRLLVETSETWLGMETADDLTWGLRARDILAQLSDIMWIIRVDDKDQVRWCRGLRVHRPA